jgi:hypothetical protein
MAGWGDEVMGEVAELRTTAAAESVTPGDTFAGHWSVVNI